MANSGVGQVDVNINNIVTDLNNKVDLDGTNANFPHVVSRTSNSYGGVVEIWSDGYCVQTGIWTGTVNIGIGQEGGFGITFSQQYKDTNYIVSYTCEQTYCMPFRVASKTVNGCTLQFGSYEAARTLNRATYRIEGYIR